MHPNAALITRFYESFAGLDGEAMAACYHADATFSDPVFPALRGAEVGDMWRMLATGARDFQLTFRDVEADDTTGTAHWEARYTFSKTKRPVHNIIRATFTFKDGRILTHADDFDLWRWSRQALGATGTMLGWSPVVQGNVRAQAAGQLDAFRSRR